MPAVDRDNTHLVIFVHGFLGDFLGTWGIIPRLLLNQPASDPTLDQCDYLFVGYETTKISSYLDIADRISSEWRRSTEGEKPFLRMYSRVSLIAHSLGTLGVRQFLCAKAMEPARIVDLLHSITLFGTPLTGCPVAKWGRSFSPIASALEPHNAQLRMLRVWTEGVYQKNPWPEVRLVSGQGDWIAGKPLHELAAWPGDGKPHITTLSHTDLAKPSGWEKSVVLDHIKAALHD